MIKALKVRQSARIAMLVASASLVGLGGPALAAGAHPASAMSGASAFPSVQGPTLDRPVLTSRGPAFITGHIGSLDTTTIPGSTAQGLLINNGNGTSTLIATGSTPQIVATPR